MGEWHAGTMVYCAKQETIVHDDSAPLLRQPIHPDVIDFEILSNNVVMIMIIFMFVSFAASLTRGPMNSKISQTVSPKIQGKINGFSSGLDSIAQIIGPLAGALILSTLPPYWLGIIVALIALPAMVMSFQKIEKKKYDPTSNSLNNQEEK